MEVFEEKTSAGEEWGRPIRAQSPSGASLGLFFQLSAAWAGSQLC